MKKKRPVRLCLDYDFARILKLKAIDKGMKLTDYTKKIAELQDPLNDIFNPKKKDRIGGFNIEI